MNFDTDLIIETEDRDLKLEEDKRDWIFLHGSDLLQRSVIQGYESERRYIAERVAIEYPGFHEPAKDEYVRKTDSPPEACLKACVYFDGAYCSEVGFSPSRYYVTIDDYLGTHTIIKRIRHPYRMSRSDKFYSLTKDRVLLRIGTLSLMCLPLVCLVGLLFSPHSYQPLTPAQERESTRELLAPIPSNVSPD